MRADRIADSLRLRHNMSTGRSALSDSDVAGSVRKPIAVASDSSDARRAQPVPCHAAGLGGSVFVPILWEANDGSPPTALGAFAGQSGSALPTPPQGQQLVYPICRWLA